MARAKTTLEPVATPPASRMVRGDRRRVLPVRQRRPARNASYERRYRQTIRSIDVWSVLKISLCFYLCALIVVLLAAYVWRYRNEAIAQTRHGACVLRFSEAWESG